MVEIEKLFKDKPYLYRMGAKTVSKRYNVSEDKIRKYKQSIKVSKRSKILILDIETAPLQAYVWSRWKQNVYLEQTISEWFMISWSAKWLNDDKIYSDVLTSKEILLEDDKRIVSKLWQLLDECDIVIAHNGKRFDIPKINARFIIHDMYPPSFYKQIDTKEIASRQFGFSSNKLDALAGYFNIEHKDDTDFELWKRCMAGHTPSLKYMEKYNRKDIVILEKIYLRLRPWIPSHPNMSLYNPAGELQCTACGSTHLKENNHYYTNRNKFKVYRCEDCDSLSRDTKGEIKLKTLSPIPR